MKKIHTSERLKQLMNERNLKQIDILNLALPICEQYDERLGRNDISQYISGKVEPGQKKLFILAKALDVSEAWLMGCDVPMERADKQQEIPPDVINNLMTVWESEEDSVASDLKALLTIQNIDNAIRQQEANTYIIHGSEGKGTVIKTNIPDDKYLLVGEGDVSELTKKEYSALKSVLDAMSSLDDE